MSYINSNYNYVSDILDEIALEGLDGITVETLWMRLSFRPKFAFAIDDNSKKFLWDIIIQLKDLQFFELPQVRPPLKYFDYSVTEEKHCKDIRLELDKVYPYCSVKNVPGIFGSCKHYFTRVEVTNEVTQMSLEEIELQWGSKLVIVASQNLRTAALMGNCCVPNIDFATSLVRYEILEKVGRCRQLGAINSGKGSLQSIHSDLKSIFHHVKCLMKVNLVRKRSLLGSTHSNSYTSVIYLPKFFEEGVGEGFNILELIIKELKARPPDYMMPCMEIYKLLDKQNKQRLKRMRSTNRFKKYVTMVENIPYRVAYPDATPEEYEMKSKVGEKVLRCFKLVDPKLSLDTPEEKECDSDDEDGFSGFLPRGICYKNMPMAFQAYHHIKSSGAVGLTHTELGQVMGLNKFFVRGLIKRLTADNLCKFYVETEGKWRAKRYIVGEHAETKAAASELSQMISESVETAAQNDDITILSPDSGTPEKRKVSQIHEELVSYRSLKRVGLILKTLKANKYRLMHQIQNYLYNEEKQEGLTIKIDRHTVIKLLKKLEEDGLVKKIIITGKLGARSSVTIYTEPGFEPDEATRESIYARHVVQSPSGVEQKEESEIVFENEFSLALVENMTQMQSMFKDLGKPPEKPASTPDSAMLGLYAPRFMRLNILHDFIFHLVYDYTGILDKNQDELVQKLGETASLDDEIKKEMPQLYYNEVSPYMFVPPLTYSGKFPGWFLISDVLIRMPLSIMVKLIKVTESCPELSDYVHHPIRKHFLVKDLPAPIRRVYLTRPTQVRFLYDDLKRLSFIGLIQFGPMFGKALYQTILYLNRKASLLDTTPSPPCYMKVPPDMEFEVRKYELRTKADVKKYWVDMFDICRETKLGKKEHSTGGEASEREFTKDSLKELTVSKTVEQAIRDDNGEMPGDRLGAAGIDSVMFSCLRMNWTGSVSKKIINNPDLKPKKVEPIKVPLQKVKTDQKNSDKPEKTKRKKVEKPNPNPEPKKVKVKQKKVVNAEGKRIRRPSYDETDLEALKLMNSLRVSWSTAEDHLLLLFQVAMMFLSPTPKIFAKIPKVELRRALRHYLPESQNKTKQAIGRRIVYMMKNPTTQRSVKLCLESLKQMPESKKFDCSELIEHIKPTAPDLAEKQQKFYEVFHELLAFLKDRFIDNPKANPMVANDDLIPDTIEEFMENYRLDSEIKEELDIKTIRENVIKGLLLSSFCCRSDKTSSAIQLFEIYRQYHEDELQNAIKSLHSGKVITIKKTSGSQMFKTGQMLPLTLTPFKLSYAFQLVLNTKYSQRVYTEAWEQLSRLQTSESDIVPLNLSECNFAIYILGTLDILTLQLIFPDSIISLDKEESANSEYSKIVEKYCKMLESSKSDSKSGGSSGMDISEPEDESTVKSSTKRKLLNSDEVPAKKGKLKENVEESVEKKSSDEVINIEGQLNEKQIQSSRLILYMMREEAKKNSQVNMGGRHMSDFFVVNSSQVSAKFEREELDDFIEQMDPKITAVVVKNIISRYLLPLNVVNEDEVMESMKDDFDFYEIKEVIDCVCSKKELGATAQDIKENCYSDVLGCILERLIVSKVIVKAGINETRYVSHKYSSPWLLHSFKMKRIEREKLKPSEATAVSLNAGNEEDEMVRKKLKGVVDLKDESYSPPSCSTKESNKIKLIIRPWMRIDGTLNRKVLDRLLGTVLDYVLTHPGCSMKSIMNKFIPFFAPIWTKDLVEILNDIGCLIVKAFVVVQKASLFSKSRVEFCDKYTGLEDDDCVLVEAKPDAITTLALFIGKKSYSKDFLSE